MLEHHPDPPLLGLDEHSRPRHGKSGDGNAAGIGPLEAGNHAQQGRLARAARTEEGDDISLLESQ